MGANSLSYFAPLDILKNVHISSSFRPDQLQALALISLTSYGTLYNIALVFFGFHCLLVGYLIFRSTFLPRALGILMALAGLAWITYLYQPFADALYPYILLPSLVGEGLLTLWLLAIGVNPLRWKDQANPERRNTEPRHSV